MVGIIAIKTERTQIHFLMDVLVVVASLDLKVPNDKKKVYFAAYVRYKTILPLNLKSLETMSSARAIVSESQRL